MWINEIKFLNFRNQSENKFFFGPNINIIKGKNGIGKTSILEGIYFLSNFKSHRTSMTDNLVAFEQNKCIVSGLFQDTQFKDEITLQIGEMGKIAKINDQKVKRKEIIQKTGVIIFEPGDLNLVKGEPNLRRRYLDDQLNQLYSNYYQVNSEYENVLKKRNNLLKQFQMNLSQNEELLKVLTDKLIEKAARIYQYRHTYIENLNNNIASIYYDITNLKHFNLKYITNPTIEDFTNFKNELNDEFTKIIEQEKEKGVTLIGPHRDDIQFCLENNELKHFGSQGQQRIGIIALKLAEIPIFYKVKGNFPILLLDDIFSELDIEKRNKLLKYIDDSIQIIITTTELNNIDQKLLKKAKIIDLDEVENERI